MPKDRYSDNYTIEVLQGNTFGVSSENANISEESVDFNATGEINLTSDTSINLTSDVSMNLAVQSLFKVDSDNDIELSADNDIKIEADYDLSLKANYTLELDAGEDLKITSDHFTLSSNQLTCGDITCDSINIGSGGNDVVDWANIECDDLGIEASGDASITTDGKITLTAGEGNEDIKLHATGENGDVILDSDNGQIFLYSGGTFNESEGIKLMSGDELVVVSGNCSTVQDPNSYACLIQNTATGDDATDVLLLKQGYGNPSSGTYPSIDCSFITMVMGSTTSARTGGTAIGQISSDGAGGVDFLSAFTGKHPSVIKKGEANAIGMIVESTGEIWANNNKNVSTCIPKMRLSDKNNSKSVYGVIGSLSGRYEAYALGYGVDQDSVHIEVNSVGEGKVWVTNISGDIENGDYIASSEVLGYGRLQDDDILHSYSVAKCVEEVDWALVSDTIEFNGQAYKRYLIGCTYHCG